MNAVYPDQPMTARRARMIAQRGEGLVRELQRLGENADLPEWVQAKVESAYQMIDSAFDYLEQMDAIEEITESDLLKARATKYTYRKRVGTNPKTGAAVYKYYYDKPKTQRAIQSRSESITEGSSFVFHHKGQRGHFHIEKVNGDRLQIIHDETGHSVEVTKKELRALLLHEHREHLEARAKEKAGRAVERGKRTKSGTHKGAERTARQAEELAREAKSAGGSVAAALGEKPKPTAKKPKPTAKKPAPETSERTLAEKAEEIQKKRDSFTEFLTAAESATDENRAQALADVYKKLAPVGLTDKQTLSVGAQMAEHYETGQLKRQVRDLNAAVRKAELDAKKAGFDVPQTHESLPFDYMSDAQFKGLPEVKNVLKQGKPSGGLDVVQLAALIIAQGGVELANRIDNMKTRLFAENGYNQVSINRMIEAIEAVRRNAQSQEPTPSADNFEMIREMEKLAGKDTTRELAEAFREYEPDQLIEIAAHTYLHDKKVNQELDAKISKMEDERAEALNEAAFFGEPEQLAEAGGSLRWREAQEAERKKHEEILQLLKTRDESFLKVYREIMAHLRKLPDFQRRRKAIFDRRAELAEAAAAASEPTPSADNFETMPESVPDGTAFRQFNRRESKALDLYTDEQFDRGLKAIANVLKENSGFSGAKKEFLFGKYHPAKKPLHVGQRSLEHNRQMGRDSAFRDLASLYGQTVESGEAPSLDALVFAFKQAAGEPQQSRREVTKSLEYKTVHDLYLSLINDHLRYGSDFAVGLKGLYKKKIWIASDRKEAALSMAPGEHLKRARLYIDGIKDGFVEFSADSGSSAPVLKTDNLPSDLKGDRFDKLLKHIGLFYQRLVDKHIENKEEANLLARYAESPLEDKTPEELEALKDAARVVEAKGENQTDFEKGAVRFILNEIEALTNPRIKSRQMKIEEAQKSSPFTTEERRFVEAFDRISESEAPSSPAAQARNQLIEAATPEPTPSADNFETMPESEAPSNPAAQAREELAEVAATATAEAINSRQPRAEDMSDEELTSAIKHQVAEIFDLGTEIDNLKRLRRPYSDKSKKRQEAQVRLNELKTARASRTGQAVEMEGEGSKVPPENEMKAMIAKLQKMVEQNPSLAKSPEIMALLGGGSASLSSQAETDLVITLGGKTQNLPVKYKIVEAGDAIGSHHAGGFYKRPDYPEGVQEREYHNARGPEQNKVIVQAQNLNPQLLVNTNPDAMNGPPILTQDGIALGGNSRVMSVQRAYMAHPEKAKAYKTYLYRKAHTFGIDPQELDKFSAPLLVRELVVEDKSKESLAKLVRAMNEGLTQEFDATAEGRNAATKLLGENVTLKAIATALRDSPDNATINSILKTPGARLENIKRALFRDGIMTSRNSNKYIHEASGAFNDTGVSLVKKMITGYVLRDDELLRALSPSTEDNLNNALATLSAVGINREDANDIQNAVFIYNLILNKDTATGGINSNQTPEERDKRVKMYMEEDRAFDFGEGTSDKINIERLKDRVKKSPLSSAFLKILALNPTSKALNSTMKQFVALVDVSDNMDMFAAAPIDFTSASRQIAQKLASQHKTSAELYKSLIKRGTRSARTELLRALM